VIADCSSISNQQSTISNGWTQIFMSDIEHEPTALRRQYLEIKRNYPNTILFFRLGDFYETFDDDAETIARDLEIVLTSRANMYRNGTRRVPMAGIPFHAVDTYIARLIEKGHHVAICEQTGSEPINGLVTREVIRVVTPGTIVEPGLLDASRNNYLAALVIVGEQGALAHADITTGHFAVAVLSGADVRAQARHELARLRPAELLTSEDLPAEALVGVTVPRTSLAPKKFDPGRARNTLLEHFGAGSLAGLGLEGQSLATAACAAVIGYVRDTQAGALRLLTRISLYHLGEFMALDPATRRNLELTETLRGGQTRGSLLGVLDHTVTPMGARLLRHWVSQPLLDVGQIRRRHDRVGTLHTQGLLRAELLAALKPLSDVERIANRIIAGSAQPRDMVALRETLAALPGLALALGAAPAGLGLAGFDPCGDVLDLLLLAIAEEPPAVLSKHGCHPQRAIQRELDGDDRGLEAMRVSGSPTSSQVGARADGYQDAQGRLQQGLRLLHRNFTSCARAEQSARVELHPQADPGQRGALHHAGAEGVRNAGAERRRAHPRDRDCGCSGISARSCRDRRRGGCWRNGAAPWPSSTSLAALAEAVRPDMATRRPEVLEGAGARDPSTAGIPVVEQSLRGRAALRARTTWCSRRARSCA
jgi:hypothetical protein